MRAPRGTDAPWRNARAYLEDVSVARHERDVNRELHEAGVNGVARGNDKRMAVGQVIAIEQPGPPRPGIERARYVIGKDTTAADVSNGTPIARFQQRRQKGPAPSGTTFRGAQNL